MLLKHWRIIAGGFLLLLLQTLAATPMSLGAVGPDFVLLLVAFIAIGHSPVEAAIAGFGIGLFQDLFNPEMLGLNAMAMAVVGYGLASMAPKGDPTNALFFGWMLIGAALAHDFIYLVFFTGLNPVKLVILFVTISAPSAFYTAVVGALLHRLTSVMQEKVTRFGKARS